MDYGNILSRSWRILWENKWLLVLGFLAALGGSSGGGGSNASFSGGPSDFDLPPGTIDRFQSFLPIFGVLFCLALLFGIVMWLVSLIGEAGLIASVNRLELGEKMSLGAGFRAGLSYLKQMVGLSLLLFAPVFLVGLILAAVGLAAFFTIDSGNGGFAPGLGALGLCILPLICVIFIYTIVAAFVYPFAQRSIIMDGYGVTAGLRHGWQVLKSNFVEILLLAILFAVITFLIGAVLALVAVPVALISAVPMAFGFMSDVTALTIGTAIIAAIGFIVLFIVASVVMAIPRTWQSAAFTLGYREWTGKAVPTL